MCFEDRHFLLEPADQAGGPQGTGAVAAQEAEKEQQSAQIQDQRLQTVIGEVPILRRNDQMQDADENQVAHNQGDRGHGGKKDDAGFGAAFIKAVQCHIEAAVTLVAGHPEQKQEA